MPKPRPFRFELTDDEVAAITRRPSSGAGGFQILEADLQQQLARGRVVELSDEQLGAVIRHMTRYGSGGFQSRLSHAFRRSISALMPNDEDRS